MATHIDIHEHINKLEKALLNAVDDDNRLKISLALVQAQKEAIKELEKTQRAVADANVHISDLYMNLEDAQDLILQQKSEILQQNEELNASIDQIKMVNEHLEELNSLNQTLQEAEEKSNAVKQAHKSLIDSVNYSKRIQFNLLPKARELEECYKHFFSLYLPKAIVSGDYYWFHSTPHYNILISADCTGHGVSGAFMMLIGHNILDKLVCQWGLYDPADLLHEMNIELRKVLRQHSDEDIRDSMEMTIFVDDKIGKKVHIASAKRPIVRFRDKELTLIKGNKYPVGDAFYPIHAYQKHTFDKKPHDRYYFFSDGITDQFGGEHNRKITTKGFLKLLGEMQNQPMQLQQFNIQKFFKAWKGTQKQLDDVMVLGLELS